MRKRHISQIFDETPIAACYNVISHAQSVTIVAPDVILEKVCNYFDTNRYLLMAKTRKREVVYPRQVAMYLMKYHTRLSLAEIGKMFGGRDHTTVIHAKQTIKDLMWAHGHINDDVNNLIDAL